MQELINDPFYEQLKAYKRCIVDYCLIEADTPHQGYRSHKDAILFAMCKVIERYVSYQLKAEIEFHKNNPQAIEEEPFPWSMDIGKAKAKPISAASLLQVPDIIGENKISNPQLAYELKNNMCGDHLPYWYAFLQTPHKTGYSKDDFLKINNVLFPNGEESLEVFEWSTDWSNYFDDGREWWGTACWSVYDRSMNRYAVIMASTSD